MIKSLAIVRKFRRDIIMWTRPLFNLPGKPPIKHADDGTILCPNCGKENTYNQADLKAGKLVCVGCKYVIKLK